MHVYFSNRIENLFEKLKTNLFPTAPFTQKIIIVPNQAIKSWIMLQLAQDPSTQIATGIKFYQLNKAFQELFPAAHAFSSHLELALAIEAEIKNSPSICTQLSNYLQTTTTHSSKKSQKRLTALSDHLAHLFEKYNLFASRETAKWEIADEQQEWQKQLWQKLHTDPSPWRSLYHDLEQQNPTFNNTEISLFAINFLPNIYHRLFDKISKNTLVHYYQLSPCRAFWLDICSDKEQSKLLAKVKKQNVSLNQQTALENLLRDKNPLLANFGRMGREMMTQIEASDPIIHEDYELNSSALAEPCYEQLVDDTITIAHDPKPLSILKAIQSDILLLRSPDNQPLSFPSIDKSIQCHIAPSSMREIEILYNNLMQLIERHSHDEDPISPQDIVVMAPDITQYEASIHAVFGQEESKLDYTIADISMTSQSSLTQGFLSLLNLNFSRWESTIVLELFANAEFQKAVGWAAEDLYQIRKWIKESGICWGYDLQHRNELLRRDHCDKEQVENSAQGTWKQGISRLLLSLSTNLKGHLNSESNLIPSTPAVEFTQVELLEQFITLIDRLKSDLEPLINQTTMTLESWSSYLKKLLEDYFYFDSSNQESKSLLHAINAFKESSKHIPKAQFSFHTIKKQLFDALNKKNFSFKESHLHAVKFCSMLPMRALPAKVIYLLGMDDKSFPKKNISEPLNLLQKAPSDYCPTANDHDRYLFLETILSARQYLIFSYSSTKEEELSSLLLTELFQYIDSSYQIDQQPPSQHLIKRHPLDSFDKEYFIKESPFPSYFQHHYLAAQAYYNKGKTACHQFIPEFFHAELPSFLEELPATIDIRHLCEAGKNPLKLFFNRSLGIYLKSDSDQEIKDEDSFAVSGLENYKLVSAALKKPSETVLTHADKIGYLPKGIFKSAFQDKFRTDLEEVYSNLRGVDKLFSVDLNPNCQEPFMASENRWIIPCIDIEGTKIVGTIDNLSAEGLVVQADFKITDILKIWPLYILLHLLDTPKIKKRILFTKSDKTLDFTIDNPQEQLKSYLGYTLMCMQRGSLMIPELVPTIMKGDFPKFLEVTEKKLNDPFNPLYNDYMNWLHTHCSLPATSALFNQWNAHANRIYKPLKTLFPKQFTST